VALGLVKAIVNQSARAAGKVGDTLDEIATRVFGAKGDQSKRSKVYSDTLSALGREEEKISKLRQCLLSIERLLLFLSAEGRAEKAPKAGRDEGCAMRPAIA
jgi:magnesium transporter